VALHKPFGIRVSQSFGCGPKTQKIWLIFCCSVNASVWAGQKLKQQGSKSAQQQGSKSAVQQGSKSAQQQGSKSGLAFQRDHS
jgi:hypothetical protein